MLKIAIYGKGGIGKSTVTSNTVGCLCGHGEASDSNRLRP